MTRTGTLPEDLANIYAAVFVLLKIAQVKLDAMNMAQQIIKTKQEANRYLVSFTEYWEVRSNKDEIRKEIKKQKELDRIFSQIANQTVKRHGERFIRSLPDDLQDIAGVILDQNSLNYEINALNDPEKEEVWNHGFTLKQINYLRRLAKPREDSFRDYIKTLFGSQASNAFTIERAFNNFLETNDHRLGILLGAWGDLCRRVRARVEEIPERYPEQGVSS